VRDGERSARRGVVWQLAAIAEPLGNKAVVFPLNGFGRPGELRRPLAKVSVPAIESDAAFPGRLVMA